MLDTNNVLQEKSLRDGKLLASMTIEASYIVGTIFLIIAAIISIEIHWVGNQVSYYDRLGQATAYSDRNEYVNTVSSKFSERNVTSNKGASLKEWNSAECARIRDCIQLVVGQNGEENEETESADEDISVEVIPDELITVE